MSAAEKTALSSEEDTSCSLFGTSHGVGCTLGLKTIAQVVKTGDFGRPWTTFHGSDMSWQTPMKICLMIQALLKEIVYMAALVMEMEWKTLALIVV